MNFRTLRETRVNVMILFAVLLILGVILAVYTLTSRESPDAADLHQGASSTRTALALTSQALLGPFPTATAPTATASNTPGPSETPTPTPTRTRTPTATPQVFITFTARTLAVRATFTNTARPTLTRTAVPARPTITRIPPTVAPTEPPPPTPTTQPPTYP